MSIAVNRGRSDFCYKFAKEIYGAMIPSMKSSLLKTFNKIQTTIYEPF